MFDVDVSVKRIFVLCTIFMTPQKSPRRQLPLRCLLDVPNAVVSRPVNPVAAALVALGPGTVEVKGMPNSITRGSKA